MNSIELIGKYHRLIISRSWEQCRYLLKLLEENSDEDFQDWDEDRERTLQAFKKSGEDELPSWALNFFRFTPRLRPALMNSHFCASYALFEYQLTWLCNIAQQIYENPFSVKDFRSSSIDRFKDYQKKLGIGFPSNSPEWAEIQRYLAIRNKIMHAGANVDSKWKHSDYSKKERILDEEVNQLALTRTFCEKAANIFEQFALKVSQSVVQDAKGRA